MDGRLKVLPMDWVERIFQRLEAIYKEQWIKSIGRPDLKDLYLTQWSSGLVGLTVNEIKRALAVCEYNAKHDMPNVVEFFHYAKGRPYQGYVRKLDQKPPNKELAKHHLDKIKSFLTKKSSM